MLAASAQPFSASVRAFIKSQRDGRMGTGCLDLELEKSAVATTAMTQTD